MHDRLVPLALQRELQPPIVGRAAARIGLEQPQDRPERRGVLAPADCLEPAALIHAGRGRGAFVEQQRVLPPQVGITGLRAVVALPHRRRESGAQAFDKCAVCQSAARQSAVCQSAVCQSAIRQSAARPSFVSLRQLAFPGPLQQTATVRIQMGDITTLVDPFRQDGSPPGEQPAFSGHFPRDMLQQTRRGEEGQHLLGRKNDDLRRALGRIVDRSQHHLVHVQIRTVKRGFVPGEQLVLEQHARHVAVTFQYAVYQRVAVLAQPHVDADRIPLRVHDSFPFRSSSCSARSLLWRSSNSS